MAGSFKRAEYVEGHLQPENPSDVAERRRRVAEVRAKLKRGGRTYRGRQTCPRCGSVFTDPAVYREHVREPHSSDR